MFHLYINKNHILCSYSQSYALHGYKSLYAHPDLEYDITYLHGIWLLARTMAHDLHATVVVASYIYYIYTFTKSSDILTAWL